ncbi:MAG: helix-turn-helix domain-containing protein [Candidatus Odinarchaeota archaeon]
MQDQELEKTPFSRAKKTRKTVILDVTDPRLAGITNPVDLQVLGVLAAEGSLTRSELARITAIPRSTLYDSLMRLQLTGLVDKFARKPASGPGRALVVFESIFNTTDG